MIAENCVFPAGAFKLAEVDMTPLLPQHALAPFAEEISSRQKRRERRAEQEAIAAENEAAAAATAAAAANSRGLSAQELKVGLENSKSVVSLPVGLQELKVGLENSKFPAFLKACLHRS